MVCALSHGNVSLNQVSSPWNEVNDKNIFNNKEDYVGPNMSYKFLFVYIIGWDVRSIYQ